MQIPSKPTTVLLAIIALLLAANLIVNLTPQEAKAQTHLRATAGDDDDDVVLVGISSYGQSNSSDTLLFRLWSDGVVEMRIAHPTSDASSPRQWRALWPEWVEIEDTP